MKYTLYFFIVIVYITKLNAQQNDPAYWQYFQSVEQVNEYADNGTELWLATNKGLVIVNKTNLQKQTWNIYNSAIPSQQVEEVIFDADGKAFIGTYDCLLGIYDGGAWETVVVPVDSSVLGPIPNPLLYDLEFTSDGSLWVGTNNGAWRYLDGEWEVFNLNHPTIQSTTFRAVREIEEDDEGHVYFLGSELIKYDGNELINLTEEYEEFTFYSKGFLENKNGKMLVGNKQTFLAEIEGDSIRFTKKEDITFPNPYNWNIVHDPADLLYFVFDDGEVYHFNGLEFIQEINPLTLALSHPVQQYFYDEEGVRWASVYTDLFRYNDEELDQAYLSEAPLTSNWYIKFAEDSEGKTYLLHQGNILSYDANGEWEKIEKPEFNEPYHFTSIDVDGNNHLWLGTDIGLVRQTSDSWELLNPGNSDFPLPKVDQLTISESGDIYAAGYYGVAHFDGTTWNMHWASSIGLAHGNTKNMGTGDQGDLWITRDIKVHHFDGTAWTAYHPDNSALPGYISMTSSIRAGEAGEAWLATGAAGLFHFKSGEWLKIDIGSWSQVFDVDLDKKGNIWASGALGLFLYNGEEWQLWEPNNSLLIGKDCKALQVSNENAVWVYSQGEGISVFDGNALVSSISEIEKKSSDLKVYPNPAAGTIQVIWENSSELPIKYELYAVNGTLQIKGILNDNRLDVSGLENGLYYLKMIQGDRMSTTKICILNKK